MFAAPLKMDHDMLQHFLQLQQKDGREAPSTEKVEMKVEDRFQPQCADLLTEYLDTADTWQIASMTPLETTVGESAIRSQQLLMCDAAVMNSNQGNSGQPKDVARSRDTHPFLESSDFLANSAFTPRPLHAAAHTRSSIAQSSFSILGQPGEGSLNTVAGDLNHLDLDHSGTNANDAFAANGYVGPWSASSATLLGDMFLSSQDEQLNKKNKKKPKGKPKRPLSAYNLFFKEERTRILDEIPDEQAVLAECKEGQRRRRKSNREPHGKIDFQSLAKLIGKRWQALSEDQLVVYKEKAAVETARYKSEMKVYMQQGEAEGK